MKMDKDYARIISTSVDTSGTAGVVDSGKIVARAVGKKEDIINKPEHYHKGGIDVIELLNIKYPPEVLEGFCIGNALKYIIRCKDKGDELENIEKAEFYVKKLVELKKK